MKQIDQEKILTAMIGLAHDAILLLDPHSIIIQANPAALSICGFESIDDIRARPIKFTDLFDLYNMSHTGIPLKQQPISLVLNGEKCVDFKCKGTRKDTGKEAYWLFSATPMFDETKNVAAVVLSIKDISSLHKSENTSPQSEEQLRLEFYDLDINIIDQNPNPMWISDASGTMIKINRACLVFFYMNADEVIGKYNIFKDTIIEAQCCMSLVKDVYKKGNIARFELVWKSAELKHLAIKDFAFVILDVTIFPIRNESGEITNAVIQHINITERKRAEEALRLSEEKFSKAFMSSPDSITISRLADGIFIEINNGSMEMFGYTREEMIGRSSLPGDLNIWVNKMDRDRMVAFLNTTGDVNAFEALFQRKDKSIINGILSARIIKMNGTDYLLATIDDVTERKKAEEALKQSEEKFSKAFMTSPDALTITRLSDGIIVDINNGTVKMFGYSREEVIGHTPFSGTINSWVNIEDRNRIIATLNATGEVNGFEAPLRHRDGSILFGIIYSRIIKMRGKDYMLSIVRDITEQKRTEEVRNRLTRELRALSDCNQALIRAENEQTLFDKICSIVCDIAEYRLAWVGLLVNENKPYVNVVSQAGSSESLIDNVTYFIDEKEETPIDIAVRSKKCSITPDFAKVTRKSLWSNYARKNDCLSAIALPLLDDKERVLGILAIYSGEMNVFEPEEIKLLGELSGDLSFGIVSLRTRFERNFAQRELIYQKELSDALLESTPGIISVIDHNGLAIRMNKDLMNYYGLTRKTFTPQDPLKFVYKDDLEIAKRDTERIPVTGHVENDIRFEFKPDEITWWNVIGHALNISGTSYVIASGFDITSRKRAEENLQKALKEKEVLLLELYHRTKNNMQVISTYLAMQAAILEDEKLQPIFNEMENRIRAMALVHEKLFKSKDLTNVDLHGYLSDLGKLLLESFPGSSDNVVLDCELEEIFVTIDIAVPIGLVVTELITNSLKYAFPGGRSGKIFMKVRRYDQGKLELHISDNGIGAPSTFDLEQKDSLGIPTILSIAQKQLRGSVNLVTEGGFQWEIIFRSDLYNKRV